MQQACSTGQFGASSEPYSDFMGLGWSLGTYLITLSRRLGISGKLLLSPSLRALGTMRQSLQWEMPRALLLLPGGVQALPPWDSVLASIRSSCLQMQQEPFVLMSTFHAGDLGKPEVFGGGKRGLSGPKATSCGHRYRPELI